MYLYYWLSLWIAIFCKINTDASISEVSQNYGK